MKKQKNLKQHIGLLLAAGLLFAGTTVSAAENEPEQPKCMTTEQVEELNLCNTLDEQEPLTVEEATRTYQAGNTVVSFLGDSITTYTAKPEIIIRIRSCQWMIPGGCRS